MTNHAEDRTPPPAKLNAVGAIPLGIFAGAGTTVQAHWTSVLASPGWVGPAIAGTVGVVGIGVALRRRLSSRAWRLAFVAFVIDRIATTLLVQPLQQPFDPVALWPYVLGTMSTFAAALWLGWAARRNDDLPALAVAFVSIDLLAAAALSPAIPVVLTAALLSRLIVAFVAAGAGCMAGVALKNAVAEKGWVRWRWVRDGLVLPLVATITGVVLERVMR